MITWNDDPTPEQNAVMVGGLGGYLDSLPDLDQPRAALLLSALKWHPQNPRRGQCC